MIYPQTYFITTLCDDWRWASYQSTNKTILDAVNAMLDAVKTMYYPDSHDKQQI